jgi:hypothetical protein
VLFLEPLGAEIVEIGIGIAKYEIQTNGKEPKVSFNPEVSEARFDAQGQMKIEDAEPMRPVALSVFMRRLHEYADKPPRVTPGTQNRVERPVLRVHP